MAGVIHLIVAPGVYGGSLTPSLVGFLHGSCLNIVRDWLFQADKIRIPLGKHKKKGKEKFSYSVCLDILNCVHWGLGKGAHNPV